MAIYLCMIHFATE